MMCGAFSPGASGNCAADIVISRLQRRDRIQHRHIRHVASVLQQITQPADVIVQLGALRLLRARRDLGVDAHGVLVHGHLEGDLPSSHAVGRVSLGAGDRVIVVKRRRSHDLVRNVRASVPPDVVHGGQALVLEDLQQISGERAPD